MSSPAAADSSPLSLSDDQLARVDLAARALQPSDRQAFIEDVHERLLASTIIGDGALHRILAACQAEFLRARPILSDDAPRPQPGKYQTGRSLTARSGR